MKRLACLLAALLFVPVAFAQNDDDVAGVRAAVLDYVEAIYDVEPERIERSVSPQLVKFGYWKANPDAEYAGAPMNYEQLRSLAGSWNVNNRQNITEDTPKEIDIYDVLDKTASAKLTALWGVDYFLLEKIDGKWMIRLILWQSPPPMS